MFTKLLEAQGDVYGEIRQAIKKQKLPEITEEMKGQLEKKRALINFGPFTEDEFSDKLIVDKMILTEVLKEREIPERIQSKVLEVWEKLYTTSVKSLYETLNLVPKSIVSTAILDNDVNAQAKSITEAVATLLDKLYYNLPAEKRLEEYKEDIKEFLTEHSDNLAEDTAKAIRAAVLARVLEHVVFPRSTQMALEYIVNECHEFFDVDTIEEVCNGIKKVCRELAKIIA